MRLSRAVSSAMTTPTPLPRGPGGTRRTAERLSAGRPRPACNPAPDGPGRALAHSPGSGPAADTEEKKVGGEAEVPGSVWVTWRRTWTGAARSQKPSRPCLRDARGRGQATRGSCGYGGGFPKPGPLRTVGEKDGATLKPMGRTNPVPDVVGPLAQPAGKLFSIVFWTPGLLKESPLSKASPLIHPSVPVFTPLNVYVPAV